MRKLVLAILFVLSAVPLVLYGQVEENEIPETLQGQYENMIENSETFQQYKVIPIVKMNAFKGSLNDTLSRYEATIETIKNDKGAIAERNDSLKKQLGEIKIELADTKELVDGISFFGVILTKTFYNIIMIGIIVGLIVLLVVVYLSFMNANRVAKAAKNDKVRVENELEELRKTAHDKQVKVKRELQTALNKIDELSK